MARENCRVCRLSKTPCIRCYLASMDEPTQERLSRPAAKRRRNRERRDPTAAPLDKDVATISHTEFWARVDSRYGR